MKNVFLSLICVLMLCGISFGQFETGSLDAFLGVDTVNTIVIPGSASAPTQAQQPPGSPLGGPLFGVSGAAFSAYHLLVSGGPAIPNALITTGGIVNVDPATAVVFQSGTFPVNNPGVGCDGMPNPNGCGLDLVVVPTSTLPPGTVFTIQGVIVNGLFSSCFRLTNPVEVTVL